MNKLLKKRMLIISISLALLLLINIGVSYSYYLGKVVGNESDTTLSFKSAGIKIQYENNSGEITEGDILSGWSTTKNFSLSSNISDNNFTNDTSKLWYEIFLYIDQNDFPSDLITYTLTPNATIVGNGTTAEARTGAGIATGTNAEGISLGLGYFTIGSNRHDYSITFNYVDNGSQYSNYPDNIFSVHIGAKVVVSSSIIIDLDGGSIEGSTTKYVSKGGTINLPIPTKNGYIFDGWVITSGDGVVDGNNVTVNGEVLNISAVWRSKSISSVLVLDLDGGTSTQDTINDIKTGEIQTLETPTRPGYIFRGWELVKGDAEISDNKLVAYDESVKIIAIWEYVVPDFTYTGEYTLINDTADNWRIKFLESGKLKFSRLGNGEDGIDVFLVGGGGGGGGGWVTSEDNGRGGSGGGGYNATKTNVHVNTSSTYQIVIGSGGAGGAYYSNGSGGSGTSAFGYSVSGGGAGTMPTWREPGETGSGGSSTYEFGDSSYSNQLYSVAGGGDESNTGNGGIGSYNNNTGAPGYSGASGIVIIRNARG